MFTRNWYNLLKAQCYGYGASTITVVDPTGKTELVYVTEGVTGATPGNAFPQYYKSTYISPGKIGDIASTTTYVYFGSGATPATVDDYCLENPYTDDAVVSVLTSDGSRVIQDNIVTLRFVYALKNLSNDPIVVSEIGLTSTYKTSGSSSTASLCACFVDRTVLDEPVTIAPGATEQVTYTMVYNCPSPPTT